MLDTGYGIRTLYTYCSNAMLLRVLFVFLGVSVDGFVDQSACLDPRHHAAQALTDHFDLVTLQQATPGSERGIACLVFQDEVLGVFAILNTGEQLTHSVLGLSRHDPRPADVLAEFGVVGDAVVHVADAAFIDQVDDQLEFVQAFEVGELRRIAAFHQCFETELDQLDGATAEHGLLTKEVSLGLLAEVGFDDAGLAATNGRGVGQGQFDCMAGGVLLHGDQCRDTMACLISRTHGVTGRFRRDHDHIKVGARLYLTVVNVETVGEGQGGVAAQMRLDVAAVDIRDQLIRNQHHDQVCLGNGLSNSAHRETGIQRLLRRRRTLTQTDDDINATVTEVLGVSMPLSAIADDRHAEPLQQAQISIFIVEQLHVSQTFLFLCSGFRVLYSVYRVHSLDLH